MATREIMHNWIKRKGRFMGIYTKLELWGKHMDHITACNDKWEPYGQWQEWHYEMFGGRRDSASEKVDSSEIDTRPLATQLYTRSISAHFNSIQYTVLFDDSDESDIDPDSYGYAGPDGDECDSIYDFWVE